MKLSIGIVGLPNVGKSTLFNTLTKQSVLAANYPFATIDPNIGIVSVPDERVDALTKLSKSAKKIPAVVEFYDIAGLVKGASEGEGLGNKFLTHIRETSAILHVVRCFAEGEIIHVENNISPLRDIEIIETELILKDLEAVSKSYDKAESESKSGKKEAQVKKELIAKLKNALEQGVFLSANPTLIEETGLVLQELNLLSSKPQLFLLNGGTNEVSDELKSAIKKRNSDYVIADLKTGANFSELIQKAYSLLGLISFFTTGEDETRAWTIRKNAKAPEAAGAIHSDFEKKFIRAEVISYEKLIEAQGWNQAKQKGWLRLEGKEYEVKDGDVMVIRHG